MRRELSWAALALGALFASGCCNDSPVYRTYVRRESERATPCEAICRGVIVQNEDNTHYAYASCTDATDEGRPAVRCMLVSTYCSTELH